MAFATKYSQANGIGTVSEEAASLEIVPKQNGELSLFGRLLLVVRGYARSKPSKVAT